MIQKLFDQILISTHQNCSGKLTKPCHKVLHAEFSFEKGKFLVLQDNHKKVQIYI